MNFNIELKHLIKAKMTKFWTKLWFSYIVAIDFSWKLTINPLHVILTKMFLGIATNHIKSIHDFTKKENAKIKNKKYIFVWHTAGWNYKHHGE